MELKDLILAIIKAYPKIDNIKIRKAIYFIDSTYYCLTEKQLTDIVYIKLKFGPAPRKDYNKKLVDILNDKKLVDIEIYNDDLNSIDYYDNPLYSLKDDIVIDFEKIENGNIVKRIIDNVVVFFKEHSTEEIIELTHNEVYKNMAFYEELPLCNIKNFNNIEMDFSLSKEEQEQAINHFKEIYQNENKLQATISR